MHDLYSLLLALAMAETAAAAMLALLTKTEFGATRSKAFRGAAVFLNITGAMALVVAVSFHGVFGHSATSEEPMNAMQFVVAHPAILVVAIAVFVVFGIAYRPV
jgi:hypothetical protein